MKKIKLSYIYMWSHLKSKGHPSRLNSGPTTTPNPPNQYLPQETPWRDKWSRLVLETISYHYNHSFDTGQTTGLNFSYFPSPLLKYKFFKISHALSHLPLFFP